MEVSNKDVQQKNSANHASSDEYVPENPNLRGDWLNFFLLLMLYTIQGVNYGLYGGISIILQSNKTVTYKDQALFSIALWPNSIKLIFAPIVDAFYIQRIGRRKSWLLPIQLSIGALLLYMANYIDDWLPESGRPNVKALLCMVFSIILLSSIQDITVDGWSLSVLKKRNVKYSSVCNLQGINLGKLIGSDLFILLVSENFRSKFVQTTPDIRGFITMKSFLQFWALSIFVITALIVAFKKETNTLENDHEKKNILQNYKLLWDIMKLPHSGILIVTMLTSKFGFVSANLMVYKLQLIDTGIPKDSVVMIQAVMNIVIIFMPLFVSKYITNPKSMTYYLKVMPIRLLFGIILVLFIFYTPNLIRKEDIVNVPMFYYFILGCILLINEMLYYFMFSSEIAFFAQISDSRYGGTYMTLLNTFNNLGLALPRTLGLKLIDVLTFKKCSIDAQNSCSSPYLKNICQKNNGSCHIYINGYFVTVPIFIVLGIIWYKVFKNILLKFESLGLSHWKVDDKQLNTEEEMEPCVTPHSL